MARHPGFRAVDGVVIRATTCPPGLAFPPWPDLDSSDISRIAGWIREAWLLPEVAGVINAASTDLAAVLAAICADPALPPPARQVRRAAESLMRYLLRWASRATPFGLFAGVAPVALGPAALVRFGDRHMTVTRPGGTWVTDTVTALETVPELLRQLPVMASNLGFARGGDWVLPCQPGDVLRADQIILATTQQDWNASSATAMRDAVNGHPWGAGLPPSVRLVTGLGGDQVQDLPLDLASGTTATGP